jgi:predicted phosphodiesterase
MRATYPDVDLLVFGHSHIPWDTEHEGLRLLNPGSPTDRRRQPDFTWMTLRLEGGAVDDVRLHRLAPPVRPPRQAGASAKRR